MFGSKSAPKHSIDQKYSFRKFAHISIFPPIGIHISHFFSQTVQTVCFVHIWITIEPSVSCNLHVEYYFPPFFLCCCSCCWLFLFFCVCEYWMRFSLHWLLFDSPFLTRQYLFAGRCQYFLPLIKVMFDQHLMHTILRYQNKKCNRSLLTSAPLALHLLQSWAEKTAFEEYIEKKPESQKNWFFHSMKIAYRSRLVYTHCRYHLKTINIHKMQMLTRTKSVLLTWWSMLYK